MKFRTEIQINPAKHKITYEAGLFFLGSCFSENIFKKVDYYKFKAHSNPFGILYNPAAIESVISKSLQGYTYSEKDFFELNERWHCYDSHSDLSNANISTAIENLNKAVTTTAKNLTSATHLFITLGTAWVYRNVDTKHIVGNCHKVPQQQFDKELLPVSEIEKLLQRIIEQVKTVNSTIQIVFTVSPIRHLKDGFVENARSKSHLITAIHNITDTNEPISYFPSYEIVQDDLRDYRFYAEDLVHPNQMAIDYLWEKFQNTWIDSTCEPLMKKVAFIQKGRSHRPFNPKAAAHQAFLKKIEKAKEELKGKFNIEF